MTEDVKIRIVDKMFLGTEFLTWLYFAALDDDGVTIDNDAMTPQKESMQIVVGKKVALRTMDATGARVSLQGAGLGDSGEVLQAVRRGANIDTLAMEMAIGSRVYAFTLGADGGFSGVKLPDLFSEPDADAGAAPGEISAEGGEVKRKRRPKIPMEDVLELRMQCLDELEAVIDALFAEFMERRLSSDSWFRDERAIFSCVRNGLAARMVEDGA